MTIGLLLPVGVFTARDHGAGDHAGCAAWLKHGREMALLAGGGAFLLLAALSTQLHRFGQPAEVVADGGVTHVTRERETITDLMAREAMLP